MGTPIVEVDEFTASYPSIANGEAGNGTVFTAPHQVAANRTKFLKGILDGGVRRIRQVANSISLKALTGLTNGDIAQLARTGLYTYASDTGGDLELAPRRYTVDAGGILRAVAFGIDALNVANGVAGLDSGAKVPSAQLRGHVVARYAIPDTTTFGVTATGTGAFAEETASFVSIPNVIVNDILVGVGNIQINPPGSTNYLQLAWRLRDAADVAIAFTQGWMSSSPIANVSGWSGRIPVSGCWRVESSDLAAGSTLKVTFGHVATTGQSVSASNILNNASILHIRNPSLWAFWTNS